jgi:hypothetical protein
MLTFDKNLIVSRFRDRDVVKDGVVGGYENGFHC